ncbi:MAG: hypothetical protein E3J65_03645 [Dehalococcoidia bacterium]|nr:MAG: hypothetical protein E3J65_03645 [Dehalococcoidia bacterium]
MNKTYTKGRGYHHWLCVVCGAQQRERIPDQSGDEYQHNPANPWLAVCGDCNRGSPSARIRLGNSSLPPEPNLTEETQMPAFEGVWGEFWEIAKRFKHKAPWQDREDLRHNIIIRLVEVATVKQASGEAFTELGKLRTASFTVLAYWRDTKRNGRVISLNTQVEDWELNPTELIDTIADDSAIDLEAWVDARTWLLGCPKRLVEVAHKRASGVTLELADRKYLCKWRKRAQKRLF